MWSSKKIVWSLLILASMLLTIPSTTCAQAVPATSNPVSGRPLTIEKIVPADVLARVGLLRDEIELIRFEMGQPKNQQTEIVVTDVIPRQVIFQAMTLFRKANQLHFELTGESGNELGTNLPAEIRPLHVWLIVNAAYRRILTVKRKLGITEHIEENPQDLSTTPTEVFRAIIQAHRQFDWLLKQRPSTRDVFHQTLLATHFAARLLEQFPGATLMPPTPAFEHGKRPVDVYTRLVACYARIRAIAERSGIEVLKLETPESDAGIDVPAQISPSNVYNIAILVVSELAYLHARLKYSEPPMQAYDPGLKLPAHVYQRAGILLLQLTELEKQVDTRPSWLY